MLLLRSIWTRLKSWRQTRRDNQRAVRELAGYEWARLQHRLGSSIEEIENMSYNPYDQDEFEEGIARYLRKQHLTQHLQSVMLFTPIEQGTTRMNTPTLLELTALIQALIHSGRIPHPVMLDDQVLNGDVVEVDDQPGATNNGPIAYNGWIFPTDGTASPIGAPMSTGVEALRAELLAVDGGQKFADKLPKYHIIRWWSPASRVFANNVQDVDRYKRPADISPWPLIDTQWDNIVDNIWLYMAELYSFAISGSGYTDRLRNQYRGTVDHKLKWSVAAAMAARQPGGWDTAVDLYEANAFTPYVCTRNFVQAGPGQQATHYKVERTGTKLPDHCTYDVWWNGQSDEDVTRYYREWAIAFGARI